MLSPGQFYLKVPKGLEANRQKRKALLNLCKGNPAMQRAVRERCAKDILYFINLFVWQFNPRVEGGLEVGPFITWDFQDRAILDGPESEDGPGILWCIEHNEDIILEKSREMGASWLCLIILLWLFLFRRWQKFHVISRSEAAVEDENSDSLFWKIDFMLRFMPDWLKGNIKRRKLYFGQQDNDSIITGEASTGRSGVGGRAKVMFIDEFSQIKEDFEVLDRTSDTTGCRIFNGTHKGLDTAFFKLCDPESVIGQYIKRRVMHWTQHPEKRKGLYEFNEAEGKVRVLDTQFPFAPDFQFVYSTAPLGGPFPGLRSPWYDKECRRKSSPQAVAMDLDINPSGSVSQFFDPQKVHSLIRNYCLPPFWVGDIIHDREIGTPQGLFSRKDGPLKLWFHLDAKGNPPLADYVIGGDISSGAGCTPTVLSIANGSTGEKVAEYTDSFTEPSVMAVIAYALAWFFKNERDEGALLCWEIPGPGQAFGKKVLELGYRKIFVRPGASKKYFMTQNLPGWVNSRKTQRILLEDYRADLYQKKYLNRSAAAMKECLAFKYGPGGSVMHPGEATNDPAGASTNHGDHVMADAMAAMLCRPMIKQAAKNKKELPPSILSMAGRFKMAQEREAAEED